MWSAARPSPGLGKGHHDRWEGSAAPLVGLPWGQMCVVGRSLEAGA